MKQASHDTVTVLITHVDGRLCIMDFVTRGRGTTLPFGATWDIAGITWLREPTDENIFAEVSKAFGEEAAKYRLIDKKDLPKDRTNRDSWVDDGKKIVVK